VESGKYYCRERTTRASTSPTTRKADKPLARDAALTERKIWVPDLFVVFEEQKAVMGGVVETVLAAVRRGLGTCLVQSD